MSTGKVQTDIEVRTHAGRVCRVFGYELSDALGSLTGENMKQGTVAL